jgi:hypothetical protein
LNVKEKAGIVACPEQGSNCLVRFAVEMVSRSTFGRLKWIGLTCIGLPQGISGGLVAAMFEAWF